MLGREPLSYWADVERALPAVKGEAWKWVRTPLPPAREHLLFRTLRLQLGIPDDRFFTDCGFGLLGYLYRQALSRVTILGFLRAHHPIVRHTALRRRRTLEYAGLIQRVAVNVHSDADAPPGSYRGVNFQGLGLLANRRRLSGDGAPEGRPYFSFDGLRPATQDEYAKLFATFEGKYGITNVWEHPPLHNGERVKLPGSTKYAHLNQKPLSLIGLIIQVSSKPGDVIWEPFGGLCTAGIVAHLTGRIAFCAEVDQSIFQMAVARLKEYDTKFRQQPALLDTYLLGDDRDLQATSTRLVATGCESDLSAFLLQYPVPQ
ncbi:MAG: hypothetical protein J7601_12415 [Chloroflexi bacterium]|nr:hypothetical protein [Chloroflexota bacterium]